MIAVLLLLVAPGTPVLGAIGRQDLPASGCAAYLWWPGDAAGAPALVAMAGADPARLRLSLDGKTVDLVRSAARGEEGFGLPAAAEYRADDLIATLDLTVAVRPDLRNGAAVPQATLSLTREGGDQLVVPLAGLVGCRVPG